MRKSYDGHDNEQVFAWVDWFNNHRLSGPIGHTTPAEAEANYCAAIDDLNMVA